jgi:carbon-monoxide dehydrogenase small subunit
MRMTGTHTGCEQGTCTVIIDDMPVCFCPMFAVQGANKRIPTVEGLARDKELHPFQCAFIKHHGLQCGFFTRGLLMLAAAVLERDPESAMRIS